jgi:hypothetical protein
MLKIARQTKLPPEEAIKKAIEFFGPIGYGLKVTEKGHTCVHFEGGGGDILVTAFIDRNRTYVDIESREWEFQAQDFLRKLG